MSSTAAAQAKHSIIFKWDFPARGRNLRSPTACDSANACFTACRHAVFAATSFAMVRSWFIKAVSGPFMQNPACIED
jgi:hypothetical protein